MIGVIASAMAVMNITSARTNVNVTNSLDSVMMSVRQARERAIAERRIYKVTFAAAGTVTVTQFATNTVVSAITLQNGVAFSAQTGLPNTAATTPDGFGTGPATGAIYFDVGVGSGDRTTVFFYPDGSAHDVNGNINNGVLYLAIPGKITTTRALSLWGLTGRLRSWQLVKNSTAGTYKWQ